MHHLEQTDSMHRAPINAFVVIIAAVAALGGILFGFDTGVISGAILFIAPEFHLSAWANGLVVSAVLFGALVGSAVSGRFSDWFGRRNVLLVTALIFIVGTLASSWAPNATVLMLSRIVIGIAIGVASFVSPLYISEISPPQFRGALVSLNQLAITLGIVLSYAVDRLFADTGAWRMMLAAGVIPALCLLVGLLFLPKSPRWMVLVGFPDKARVTLQKLRGTESVDAELYSIQESLEKSVNSSWRDLFARWVRPAVLIALVLAFLQQCTGINTIIYYAPTIFKLAGFQSNSIAILATVGVGIANVVFTMIGLPLVDKWGRRPLLFIGLSGMALSLIMLSAGFYWQHSAGAWLPYLCLLAMIVYIASFAVSLGMIMWVVIAEVFPLHIRGIGTSIGVSISWGFNMIVALTFLTLIQHLGASGTFLLYAIAALIGLFFVHAMVPETKDCTLEEIEDNLRHGLPARQLGQPLTSRRG